MTSLSLRVGRRVFCNYSQCALLQQSNRSYTSVHDIYSGKKKLQERKEESKKQLADDNSAQYSTRLDRDFEGESRATQRYDDDTGVKPTNFQRYALVVTRLFPSRSSIPEYVAASTIYRMGNRLRIVFITVGVITCFFIFLTLESSLYKKILRDRVRLANQGPPE